MYVTNILGGKPYQSYIPEPLFPSVTKAQINWFQEWDGILSKACNAAVFASGLSHTVVQSINKPSSTRTLGHADTAVAQFLQRERIGLKHLKKINGVILGNRGSDLRNTPVWIGAPHPSLSWHVGSPPQMLENLMKNLLEDPPSYYPASMLAIVCLFRILQIHPFADGNGRTARFYAAWLTHGIIGPSVKFLDVLNALWQRSQLDINAISLTAQSEKSFDPIFDCIGGIAKKI